MDGSFLTEADLTSNASIVQGQKNHTVYSHFLKKNRHLNFEVNKDLFWLVDFLVGTKQFINANGAFTLNIALIKSGYLFWDLFMHPL